jgi:hypothetical protein
MSQDYLVLLVAGLLVDRIQEEVSCSSRTPAPGESWVRAFTTKLVNMFGPVTTDQPQTFEVRIRASGFLLLTLTAHMRTGSCVKLTVHPESCGNLEYYSNKVPFSLCKASDADVLNALLEERNEWKTKGARPGTTKQGLVAGAVELIKAAASVAFPQTPCHAHYIPHLGEERPPYQFTLSTVVKHSTAVKHRVDERALILPVEDVELVHDAVDAFSMSESWTRTCG